MKVKAMIRSRRLSNVICFGLATVCLSTAAEACADETRQIANDTVQAVFAQQDGAWRLTRLARCDGSDALEMNSDEFEILLFDGRRFTVDAYQATGDPKVSTENGAKTFQTVYRRKTDASPLAPESVTVTYQLGAGPYLHKMVYLDMEQQDRKEGCSNVATVARPWEMASPPSGDGSYIRGTCYSRASAVDRLQVLRFSTPRRATRGGEGQPVFIGNWFFGMDYPGFYSRHSDGFEEPDFNYRWHYTIDLEGRDTEAAPRDGLVTLFHFPGYANEQADKSFGIMSQRAVIGIARKPGEGAELALMDYIAQTRKPPRSNLHFNNWYSLEAKAITVDSFVNHVGRAAAWAQHNQDRLVNTVLVGGDCSQGKAYGFVSWVQDRAILTVRNPDRRFQTLEVPFDASVYYRGSFNRPFKARAIYPYLEEMPWRLVSGQTFEIGIPGDTTVVFEIDAGIPTVDHTVAPDALPAFAADLKGDAFSVQLRISDADMPRCDLLVQPWGTAVSQLDINGESVEPDRRQVGKAWSLSAYDLRTFRGQQIAVKGQLVPIDEPKLPKNGTVPLEVWLVIDRKVEAPGLPDIGPIPFPIAQDYRRQTQELIPRQAIRVVEIASPTDTTWTGKPEAVHHCHDG